MTKTQVYLEEPQYQALKEEAHHRKLSLAALVRGIVREHFSASPRTPATPPEGLYMSIVGLGKGGRPDVSTRHDAYLGQAADEHRRKHSR